MRNGFPLIDTEPCSIKPRIFKNHTSAIINHDAVEKRLLEEIKEGNYHPVNPESVRLVSPIAAVPKPDGDIRLIHDLSYPLGEGLNNHAIKDECKYESLQDALNIVQPGMWMAKCDLKWAYRSVPTSPKHHSLTGLQWKFKGHNTTTTLIDKALPFGARKSPAHFNRLTKSIKRMMKRRGFNCVVYLDDFWLCENSFERCALALDTLITLLRKLGFRINWNKVVDPCQRLTFLGINIDLIKNILSLDDDKTNRLHENLSRISAKTRASKKELQQIAGQLNWACNVIIQGKAFLTSIYRAIGVLNRSHHKLKLSEDILHEIRWWINNLQRKARCRAIWSVPRQTIRISTDATLVGGGAFHHINGAWIHRNWVIDRPDIATANINVKEFAMIEEAIKAWAPSNRGAHFEIQTDNLATVYVINKCHARSLTATRILKNICNISFQYNITIQAVFLPGKYNNIADSISRLHCPGQFSRMCSLLDSWCFQMGVQNTYMLLNNMSTITFIFICPQLNKPVAHSE